MVKLSPTICMPVCTSIAACRDIEDYAHVQHCAGLSFCRQSYLSLGKLLSVGKAIFLLAKLLSVGKAVSLSAKLSFCQGKAVCGECMLQGRHLDALDTAAVIIKLCYHDKRAAHPGMSHKTQDGRAS